MIDPNSKIDPNRILEALGNCYEDKNSTYLKPPFGYPGGKTNSARKIASLMPVYNTYVEPFGGSAAVMLARPTCKMEVFNDRYAGVVAFYRVLRDHVKLAQFCDMIDKSVMSKEDFYYNKETWENCENDVDRAYRWYYMISHSFGGMGRNWGLGKQSTPAGKIRKKISLFWRIHERFKNVQVDNADWAKCMEYYDSPDTVFYLDPPYMGADNAACYTHSKIDYEELMSVIKHTKGFVALSGYANKFFDDRDFWTDRYTWDKQILLQSIKFVGDDRGKAQEVVWIKDAQDA